MTLRKVNATAGAALALALVGFAAVASAQSSEPADAQTTPQAAQPTEEKDCVTDTGSGFRQDGRSASYVIELQNNCERRLKCEVSAFIITAKGQTSG